MQLAVANTDSSGKNANPRFQTVVSVPLDCLVRSYMTPNFSDLVTVIIKVDRPRQGNILKLRLLHQQSRGVSIQALSFYNRPPAPVISPSLALPLIADCMAFNPACHFIVQRMKSDLEFQQRVLDLLCIQDPEIFTFVKSILVNLSSYDLNLCIKILERTLDSASRADQAALAASLCVVKIVTPHDTTQLNTRIALTKRFVFQSLRNANSASEYLLAGFIDSLTHTLHCDDNLELTISPEEFGILSRISLQERDAHIPELIHSIFGLISILLQRTPIFINGFLQLVGSTDTPSSQALDFISIMLSSSPAVAQLIVDSGFVLKIRDAFFSRSEIPSDDILRFFVKAAHSTVLKPWMNTEFLPLLFQFILQTELTGERADLILELVSSCCNLSSQNVNIVTEWLVSQLTSDDCDPKFHPLLCRLLYRTMTPSSSILLSLRPIDPSFTLEAASPARLTWEQTRGQVTLSNNGSTAAVFSSQRGWLTIRTIESYSSGVARWNIKAIHSLQALMIGFCTADHDSKTILGTPASSLGFHGCYANTVSYKGKSKKYGCALTGSDTLECILDLDAESLSMTINGRSFGSAAKIHRDDGPFYPAISLMYPNDSVTIEPIETIEKSVNLIPEPLKYHLSPIDRSEFLPLQTPISKILSGYRSALQLFYDGRAISGASHLSDLLTAPELDRILLYVGHSSASPTLKSISADVPPVSAIRTSLKASPIFKAFSTKLDRLVISLQSRHLSLSKDNQTLPNLWQTWFNWFSLLSSLFKFRGFSEVFANDDKCREYLLSTLIGDAYCSVQPNKKVDAEVSIFTPLLDTFAALLAENPTASLVRTEVVPDASRAALKSSSGGSGKGKGKQKVDGQDDDPVHAFLESGLLERLLNELSQLSQTPHRHPERFQTILPQPAQTVQPALPESSSSSISSTSSTSSTPAADKTTSAATVWAAGTGYGRCD